MSFADKHLLFRPIAWESGVVEVCAIGSRAQFCSQLCIRLRRPRTAARISTAVRIPNKGILGAPGAVAHAPEKSRGGNLLAGPPYHHAV